MNWPSRLLISAYAFSGPFSLMNTTALFTMATASSLVAFSAANDDPPMRAAKTGAAIIHTNIRTRIISRSYPTSAVTPPQPFLVCARPLGSARTTPTRGIIPTQLPVAATDCSTGGALYYLNLDQIASNPRNVQNSLGAARGERKLLAGW